MRRLQRLVVLRADAGAEGIDIGSHWLPGFDGLGEMREEKEGCGKTKKPHISTIYEVFALCCSDFQLLLRVEEGARTLIPYLLYINLL